jgi:hypothetical protein
VFANTLRPKRLVDQKFEGPDEMDVRLLSAVSNDAQHAPVAHPCKSFSRERFDRKPSHFVRDFAFAKSRRRWLLVLLGKTLNIALIMFAGN